MKGHFIFSVFIACNKNVNSTGKSSGNSGNEQKEIVLENMEILDTEDNFEYPDESGINWKPVKIPVIHKMPEPYEKRLRNIWLRGKFTIDSFDKNRPADCYAIDLGYVPAKNLVYVNKQFAGKFKTGEVDRWVWPSSYVLPAGVELKKTNEVYIRFITNREYITLTSRITIQDR